MKLGSISFVALLATAAAQPRHGRHHPHPAKRAEVAVDIVTDIVTTTQAAAIVYVDQNGNVISTSYAAQAAPAQAPPAQSPDQGSSQGPTQAPPNPPPAATSNTPPPPAPSPSSAPSPSAPQYQPSSTPSSSTPSNSEGDTNSGGTTGSFGYGISYSPYNSDSSCKSQAQVSADFAVFSDYGFVRSYGTDCDQATTMLNAATAKGMKMVAGIYDISQVASETQTLIQAAQSNWGAIAAVVVGNEAVSDGMASVDQVVAAVNQARSMLQAAGYTGPVVTVDTSAQVIDNPQLCQVSDFAAANCHAFFDADITADQAGTYVLDQAQRVSQACGGKDTVITESGWPWAGDTNGMAVPSPENQQAALASLKSAFSNNIVLFSAFNDYWKTNTAATFGAEQFWGIYGNAPA